jgi:N-acetylmuramoyl-L-alanine amidase
MKIAIFPGHVGKDPGAVDPAGAESGDRIYTVESVLTYAISGYIEDYLHGIGLDTVLAIGTFEQRITDTQGCSVGVSIHADVCSAPSVHGHHCIYHKKSIEGKRLAECIDSQLCMTSDRSRSPHADNRGLQILNRTQFPVVLIECGFISNPLEEMWLWSREHQRSIAMGICSGTREWIYSQ